MNFNSSCVVPGKVVLSKIKSWSCLRRVGLLVEWIEWLKSGSYGPRGVGTQTIITSTQQFFQVLGWQKPLAFSCLISSEVICFI